MLLKTNKCFHIPTEAEIKEEADHWFYIHGVSVIPIMEKQPLVSSWVQWIDTPQTYDEFFNLDWGNADGIAIICGTKTKNGLYICAVDFDTKNNTEQIQELGRKILKDFPTSYTETTKNNGVHLLYLSTTKPKTITTYHGETGLELLGEKKLCIIAPSHGYEKLNDNTPTEKGNIEQLFHEIVQKHLPKKQQTPLTAHHQPINNTNRKFNKPRPCIIEALKQQLEGANGHIMRLACASEYKRLGYPDEYIVNLFRNQTDFDYNTTNKKIEHVDPEKTSKCETIKELGYCLPNCKLLQPPPQEQEKRKSASDRLIEHVEKVITEYYTDQHGTPYVRVKNCANVLNCAKTLPSDNNRDALLRYNDPFRPLMVDKKIESNTIPPSDTSLFSPEHSDIAQ